MPKPEVNVMQAATVALDRSRAETRAAFANRALMYAAIYEELEDELGADRATEIMKRAIYKRGVEIGEGYRGGKFT